MKLKDKKIQTLPHEYGKVTSSKTIKTAHWDLQKGDRIRLIEVTAQQRSSQKQFSGLSLLTAK